MKAALRGKDVVDRLTKGSVYQKTWKKALSMIIADLNNNRLRFIQDCSTKQFHEKSCSKYMLTMR